MQSDASLVDEMRPEADVRRLSAMDLLAGGQMVHEVAIPPRLLGSQETGESTSGTVRMRPLKISTLALIANASRDDSTLAPLLMIKESLVDPALGMDQIRQMHAGLVHHLVAAANRISGLDADRNAGREASNTPIGEAHIQLARHYGWTPAQVAELTPAQIAVYLAGIDQLGASTGDRRR